MSGRSPLLPVHGKQHGRHGRRGKAATILRTIMFIAIAFCVGYTVFAFTFLKKAADIPDLKVADASKTAGISTGQTTVKQERQLRTDSSHEHISAQQPSGDLGEVHAPAHGQHGTENAWQHAQHVREPAVHEATQDIHHPGHSMEHGHEVADSAHGTDGADSGSPLLPHLDTSTVHQPHTEGFIEPARAPKQTVHAPIDAKLIEPDSSQARSRAQQAQVHAPGEQEAPHRPATRGGEPSEVHARHVPLHAHEDVHAPNEVHAPRRRMATGLYALSAPDIDGNEKRLSDFAGNVTLVVNVASACGFTDENYKGLQRTYDKYKSYGFTVLAFPCNQFGQQEPGSEAQIKDFCTSHYHVTFPVFSKVEVNGPHAHPVFKYLKENLPTSEGGGGGHGPGRDLTWNFNKFLVNKRGEPEKFFYQNYDVVAVEQAIYKMLHE